MRIAQAAKQLGISTTTLKRLERQGLIQVQRDWNGDRRYTERDIATIRRLYYPPASDPTAVALEADDRPA